LKTGTFWLLTLGPPYTDISLREESHEAQGLILSEPARHV